MHSTIKICIRIFIAAPFRIAQNRKQSKYLSTVEWINLGVLYYMAIKMIELFHATVCIKIASIVSERSLTQENV